MPRHLAPLSDTLRLGMAKDYLEPLAGLDVLTFTVSAVGRVIRCEDVFILLTRRSSPDPKDEDCSSPSRRQ